MDNKHKKILIASVPVIIAIWLAFVKNKEAGAINKETNNLPVGSSNPALDTLNNDYKPPSIDINLNTSAANYLTHKYVPLFGYAGFQVA